MISVVIEVNAVESIYFGSCVRLLVRLYELHPRENVDLCCVLSLRAVSSVCSSVMRVQDYPVVFRSFAVCSR
jgi:hypothetical protein